VAQQTLTHTGSMTGYVGHGPEVRPDAGQPHAAGASVGGQFRGPFMPPDPVDDSGTESLARRTGNQKDEHSETGGEPWRYTADVAADEPSFEVGRDTGQTCRGRG